MVDRILPALGALAFSVVAIAGGLALVVQSSVSVTQSVTVLGAMAIGGLIAPSISSRNRFGLAIAVAAALPFALQVEGKVDLGGVIGIYLLGSVLVMGVEHVRLGSIDVALRYALRQFLGYSAFAAVFAVVQDLVGERLGYSGWEILIPFVFGAGAWMVVEILLWSISMTGESRVSRRYAVLSGVRDMNVMVSLIATGALFGLMFDPLGWWALPVALLPYSFAHGAFRRFQETKSTYRQTIRVLARIPEAAGLNLNGHSDRTTALAVAMAKDLGMTPEEVDDVEFAALMHDIGHITLNDPTVLEHGWTEDDLARWGAELIAGAPSLDRVSGYVRRQYEPFRKPGEKSDPTVPMVSRVVKIASAYDSLYAGEGLSELEALEKLHQGAAYEYDPEVVASLRRVLESGVPISV